MIRLHTIGPIAVQVGDTPVPPSNDLIVAALLFLVVNRGKRVSRREFAQMFFPNANGEKAHSGRQLVYRLRQLGIDIVGDSTTISLPESEAQWDVDCLLARGTALPTDLEALQSGYLADYRPRQSAEFSKWIDEHRDEVSGKCRALLVRQIQSVRARKDFRSLGDIARACLAVDPLNEEATLAAAESLTAVGAKADAMQVLEQYIDDVGGRSSDLCVAPRMLRERIATFVTDSGRESDTLIGRDGELAVLLSLVERSTAGDAVGCLMSGPAGIGKTRLIDEMCSIASLSGHAVARAHVGRFDVDRPFAILRDLGPALLDMPGAIGASPEALAAVRGLCGRGPSQYSRRPANELDSRALSADVIRKVVELVDAIAEEQPLILCIEDADRIDEASMQLLVEILDESKRVCVVVATRRRMAIPDRISTKLTITQMTLGPLPAEDAELVLDALFRRENRAVDSEFAANAIRISAGVPLFLHLLFKNYLVTSSSSALPATLSASLNARLAQLAEPTKTVFDAIVVLGKHCTLPRLEAVTQLPRYSLAQALRFLDENGFTRMMDAVIAPSHDLLATAVHRQMPPAVARVLHASAASALEHENELAIDPLEIAMHWQACGDRSRALVVLIRSADAYIRMGRAREAIRLLQSAKQDTPSVERDRAVDLALFDAYHAAGEDTKGTEVARGIGLLNGEGPVERQIAAMEMLLGAGLAIIPYSSQLKAVAADRSQPNSLRGRSARLLAVIADDLGDALAGQEMLSLIADLPAHSIEALVPKLIYETVFGSTSATIDLAAKVFKIGCELESTGPRIQAMLAAALASLRVGDASNGTRYCTHGYEYATKMKIWSAATSFSSFLAGLCWEDGDLASVRLWHQRTLDAIGLSGGFDRGFHSLEMSIQLAIQDGDFITARDLLNDAQRRYPRLRDDRMYAAVLAIQTRIDMGLGDSPTPARLDELIRTHKERQSHGGHDFVADVVVRALRSVNRPEEANSVREEYLRVRREVQPIPAFCEHLISAIPLGRNNKGGAGA
jgi:DNA-binding SARP family transcriptional activator